VGLEKLKKGAMNIAKEENVDKNADLGKKITKKCCAIIKIRVHSKKGCVQEAKDIVFWSFFLIFMVNFI